MNKSVALGIVVILVLGGGYFLFNKNSSDKVATNSTNSAAVETTNNIKAAAIIIYSSNGFSPKLTSVKSGDVVTVNNSSSGSLQMQSDPHPAHTDDTDLNVGLVSAGETKNFTATKIGTFGFHNHLNPSDTAKITIE